MIAIMGKAARVTGDIRPGIEEPAMSEADLGVDLVGGELVISIKLTDEKNGYARRGVISFAIGCDEAAYFLAYCGNLLEDARRSKSNLAKIATVEEGAK